MFANWPSIPFIKVSWYCCMEALDSGLGPRNRSSIVAKPGRSEPFNFLVERIIFSTALSSSVRMPDSTARASFSSSVSLGFGPRLGAGPVGTASDLTFRNASFRLVPRTSSSPFTRLTHLGLRPSPTFVIVTVSPFESTRSFVFWPSVFLPGYWLMIVTWGAAAFGTPAGLAAVAGFATSVPLAGAAAPSSFACLVSVGVVTLGVSFVSILFIFLRTSKSLSVIAIVSLSILLLSFNKRFFSASCFSAASKSFKRLAA